MISRSMSTAALARKMESPTSISTAGRRKRPRTSTSRRSLGKERPVGPPSSSPSCPTQLPTTRPRAYALTGGRPRPLVLDASHRARALVHARESRTRELRGQRSTAEFVERWPNAAVCLGSIGKHRWHRHLDEHSQAESIVLTPTGIH